jgi:hypothetical protein
MNITILLWILFTHFIADFVCQTHEMSINKSKSNYWLNYHVLVYSCITFGAWIIPYTLFGMNDFNLTIMLLFPITFVTHWITDYFTSRWTSRLWAKKDVHNFFVVIGLDQFIHYTTLLLTYKLLF